MFCRQKQVENADRVEEKMSFDGLALGQKLGKYRAQFMASINELSKATGISSESLEAFENGEKLPTGDEILILADFYQCDYKFFISNEKVAAFEQTETLFRRHGEKFSKNDRWAVQEILYLAECEDFLAKELGISQSEEFYFHKSGEYFKEHGLKAAQSLRSFLSYRDNEVPMDIYQDFRKAGIRVFRRRLENSKISGLFIKHPVAGKCILVNYSEDVYRQRFTAAHEAGHALLDAEEDMVISFTRWKKNDLIEVRANTFASHYLMPPQFLKKIPEPSNWDADKGLKWANKLKVSTTALAFALKEHNLIDNKTVETLKSVKVPKEAKNDPELSGALSAKSKMRKKELLELGLTTYYANLCFEAYRRNIISASRMAEMLLADEKRLIEITNLFGEELRYVC